MNLAKLFTGNPSPRDRLREARRNLATADAALAKARADSARVRELTTVADKAAIAGKSARAAVSAATQAWALEGAPGGEPPELQSLMRAADQLTEAERRARQLADAAKKTLDDAGAIPAEQAATDVAASAECETWSRVGDVIYDEHIAPRLEAAKRLRAQLDAELAPLRQALAVSRWTQHRFVGFGSELERALKELTSVPAPERLNHITGRPMGGEPSGPLVEFAGRLFLDADAKCRQSNPSLADAD